MPRRFTGGALFPEDARWNAERQAVEFEVEIGECRGVFGCRGACSNGCCRNGPHRAVRGSAYYVQRSRFETIAERKLRRRQLTEDGNVEISGRDLQAALKPALRL